MLEKNHYYDSVVLTRYLYNKTIVLDRLEECILLGNKEEAYFWAYEIYFSFLQNENELFERFFFILKTYYLNYPRLYNYLFERYKEWKNEINNTIIKKIVISDNLHMIISVFIENIMIRNRALKEPKRQLYLLVPFDIDFINLYKTNNIIPSRKTLENVCKYSLIYTRSPLINKEGLYHIIDNWLYYASRAPIWRERIYNYGGEIVDKEKMVLFENDDQLEEFYENYGFELDEQTIEIQRSTIGI